MNDVGVLIFSSFLSIKSTFNNIILFFNTVFTYENFNFNIWWEIWDFTYQVHGDILDSVHRFPHPTDFFVSFLFAKSL